MAARTHGVVQRSRHAPPAVAARLLREGQPSDAPEGARIRCGAQPQSRGLLVGVKSAASRARSCRRGGASFQPPRSTSAGCARGRVR